MVIRNVTPQVHVTPNLRGARSPPVAASHCRRNWPSGGVRRERGENTDGRAGGTEAEPEG
jgi:hypothetical protein